MLEGFRASGWTCLVASGAADHPAREELEAAGYATRRIAVNDDAFDAFITGCAPDIVVFDPETTREHAPHADARRYSEGTHYVLVDGKITIDDGEYNGSLHGKLLTSHAEGPGESAR